MAQRFPNLFIIGAMKAGTSSLHQYLDQHPDIFMARFKEPQYFAPHLTRWKQDWGEGNRHPEPGIDWYLRLFAEAGDVRYAGESSVSYTAVPWVTGCHERIHRFNPDARLIYLMRDPIERTISHYWHFVADGREDLGMLEAVRRREEYVARSDYARQLRPYIETFGPDQVFALTLEELNSDTTGTFSRLFGFLGLPDVSIDIRTRHNVGNDTIRQTRRGLVPLDTAMKHWRVKPILTRSPAIGRLADRIVHRTVVRRSSARDQVIRHLRPIMRPQVDTLTALLGRRFPEWTTLYDTARAPAQSASRVSSAST